jgi:hypothetical protein
MHFVELIVVLCRESDDCGLEVAAASLPKKEPIFFALLFTFFCAFCAFRCFRPGIPGHAPNGFTLLCS